jgi:uncharacterized protein YdaU (DUF1376 family)
MGLIKYYKRDQAKALRGMANLNLEERGAYTTILDLIYEHDGRLPDDGQEIAHWLRVDIRHWQRIRKRLIEKGKLYIYNGELHNRKADEVIAETLRRIALASDAANKRWAAYNEIKKLADADAMRPHMRWQCESESESKKLSAKIVPSAKWTAEKERK